MSSKKLAVFRAVGMRKGPKTDSQAAPPVRVAGVQPQGHLGVGVDTKAVCPFPLRGPRGAKGIREREARRRLSV